jgi:predicted DNA-binding transcriptional regulator AlpA
MVEKKEEIIKLLGMKEICIYLGRSESTVLKLIREEDFPAKKVDEEWVAHSDAIEAWKVRNSYEGQKATYETKLKRIQNKRRA